MLCDASKIRSRENYSKKSANQVKQIDWNKWSDVLIMVWKLPVRPLNSEKEHYS